ncbi:hypothetical protein LSTR_LSTR010875 [Laodelphax striatellus]|uniref:Uncharacterized protein n=1 Tax=Laodelphax striatellus TaxID=195883 RepID=A0A482XCW4_LAOST|nr:hypothetical protein LSTR_LSTR010875 [Laodelphax striatellus]
MKSPSSKYIPVAKDQFKKAILKAVEDCGGKMDFEQYFAYMKRKEKENPISKRDAVKAMFPGQTKVTKQQLINKIPGLNKKYIQESYTIEEIVEIMNELEKEKEMEIKVKAMFPGQTKVTKVQLCGKIPGLDQKYELEESYTIEEIVKIMIELEKEEEEGKSDRKEINVE